MPTATLAHFVATAQVPPRVRQATRRYLLDWLGSTLGGAEQATVLASGERTSAPLAALANAAAAHVLEMDDLDRASISHPGAPVIAAALAVGEREGATGDELLDAIAVGYEVMVRIGEALGPTHYEHWHTTGTAGTPGAAAAAARLGRLDTGATLRALGSAGTMSAGLWEFLADGAMSKQLHPAKAAHDGVLAALLGGVGFTSATRILEGPKGLLAAMSREPDLEALIAGLEAGPERWRIEGVSFKVHASCRHTHPAVDAALALRDRHGLAPEDIAAIEVRIYSQALALLEGVEPTTPYAAKFSLPFCIASALLHGDLAPARFTDETIADPATLALAARISFAADHDLDALYPRAWPSIVRLRTTSGEVLEERVDHPAGDPEQPLDDDAVAAKFVALTASQLGAVASTLATEVLERPLPSARELVGRVTRARARLETAVAR